MKYGRIICDPEEGKALLGKKVLVSDSYNQIRENKSCRLGVLTSVVNAVDVDYPFAIVIDGIRYGAPFRFIREVIEEAPTYRPFKSVDELVSEWEKRFGNANRPKGTMPLVWIRYKGEHYDTCEYALLVTEFWSSGVCTSDYNINWQDLFERYCFLDGSPCGLEVTE